MLQIDPEGTLNETNELKIKIGKNRITALEQYWTDTATYSKGSVAFGKKVYKQED